MLPAIWIALSAISAPNPALIQPPNLGFTSGNLSGWRGNGFRLEPPGSEDARKPGWVDSRPESGASGKAYLDRTIQVPFKAYALTVRAMASRPERMAPDGKLDILLMTDKQELLPRLVRTATGWQHCRNLASVDDQEPLDYIWQVSGHWGQTLRLVLRDEDDRPGCSLRSSGFMLLNQDEFESREFSRFMVELAQENELPSMLRYDTQHFVALSNAEETFTEDRMRNCEVLYRLFHEHFGRLGFAPQHPQYRLMLAMFDSQRGFEAYLGRKMSPFITGIYHSETNRFVMYDYGQNELFQSTKQDAQRIARRIARHSERLRYLDATNRHLNHHRQEASISTVMHEVAHQLSFNCGLLNRHADVPAWLAEGLACYCEPTADGSWQGIGELNPARIKILAKSMHDGKPLLPLRDLLGHDRWAQDARNSQRVLLGYAQCWVFFRLLAAEHPGKLRTYFELIYNRPTPDRRLVDFQQAFGSRLQDWEARLNEEVQELVATSPRLEAPHAGDDGAGQPSVTGRRP